MSRGSTVRLALRAIADEIFGFRFDWPARARPEAAQPRALVYHLEAPNLFSGGMVLDEAGVPYQVSRTFRSYNPAYVSLFGLRALDEAVATGDAVGRDVFRRQIGWLRARVVHRADGAATWPYDFDWREDRCQLRAPWISAMAQGLAISALVRSHRLDGDAGDLTLARAAAIPFDLDLDAGGVRDPVGEVAVFEEYAARPSTRVLDGFLFSLLGLLDLALETEDTAVARRFREGVSGLERELPLWDDGCWSWYGRGLYLAPPHYHAINRELLRAVGLACRSSRLIATAERWDSSAFGFTTRVSVYVRFVTGKQWSRMRDRLIVAPSMRRAQAAASSR
jgi:hypothetical protein